MEFFGFSLSFPSFRWPGAIRLPTRIRGEGPTPRRLVRKRKRRQRKRKHGRGVEDFDGKSITLRHGAKGDPGIIGCSDGTREAFHDVNAFPTIAGCLAFWDGERSLRAPSTGRACGEKTPCGVPADACAAGWHVCSRDGRLQDLKGRLTGEQCRKDAGAGRFVAAIFHCRTQSGCQYDADENAVYDCFDSGWCSEPVCCGEDCGTGACPGGLWEKDTHIAQGTDQGCARMTSTRAGGILCCKD